MMQAKIESVLILLIYVRKSKMEKERREIFAFYSRSLTRGRKVLYLERSIVASIFLWRQHQMMVTPTHCRLVPQID